MNQLSNLILLVSCMAISLLENVDASKPIIIRSGGLTPRHKKQILDVHNNYRSSVALGQIRGQPMAQNMMELKWDDELAAKAQDWADQCSIAHDTDRHVERFYVGQNLAATWTTRKPTDYHSFEPDFTEQINKWFAEVKKFSINSGHTYVDDTGHYSQLVWSETSLIGCGYTFYFDQGRGYTKLYICNYGPAGNVIGTAPYVVGPPSCRSYGLLQSSLYPGLCDYKDTKARFLDYNNLLGFKYFY